MLTLFKKKKILVTHDGSFHADDVFACAALSLVFEREGTPFKVIRTRDKSILEKADVVFDIGGEYNPEKNVYDHHQKDDSLIRENGIPYAAFGLVWKHFGPNLCTNGKVVNQIDIRMGQFMDAIDNGFDLIKSNIPETGIFHIGAIVGNMLPAWNEDFSKDEAFLKIVGIAKTFLSREIIRTEARIKALEIVQESYFKSEDKRLIVVDHSFARYDMQEMISVKDFPEVLYAVFPDKEKRSHYRVIGVRANEDVNTPDVKKPLPASWGGLTGEPLQKLTGVDGAIFCHRALFMCVASSKDAALSLAKLALDN